MIPNTLLTPHQSINLLNTNSLMNHTHNQSSLNTPPSVVSTPKRKRGRPPKPNNFSSKITKTINISVNTSPLSNSPDAENNSNQIVKRGIPDIFTPTMRVSPNANLKMRRRSKKNSISSIDGINSPIKQRKNSYQSAQSSPANDYINSKTLDNISMITNNHPSQNTNLALPMHQKGLNHNPYNSPPASVKQSVDRSDRNLLPPVLIKTEKSISPANTAESLDDFNDFNLRLMIDDLGKAILSNQRNVNSANPSPHTTTTDQNDNINDSQQNLIGNERRRLFHSNSVIGIESNYMDSQSSINELDYGQAPNQYMQQSLQSQQRPVPVKYHSDFAYSENNLPQTPKPKENYLLSSGLTPIHSNLGFPQSNLTPQLNSLMNSIINSPKKVNTNSQFLFNQEMFMNNNFNYNNDFGGQINQNVMATPSQQIIQNTQATQQPQSPFQYGGYLQNQNQPQTFPMNSSFQFNDDSDARLALKKMIHVKRR